MGPTMDAISEVRTMLANYQAEYGRATSHLRRLFEVLGVERSNLYRKMKTLGIGPKE